MARNQAERCSKTEHADAEAAGAFAAIVYLRLCGGSHPRHLYHRSVYISSTSMSAPSASATSYSTHTARSLMDLDVVKAKPAHRSS